jgi:hypothetical protein
VDRRITQVEKISDLIKNRTCDLPPSRVMPQPTHYRGHRKLVLVKVILRNATAIICKAATTDQMKIRQHHFARCPDV